MFSVVMPHWTGLETRPTYGDTTLAGHRSIGRLPRQGRVQDASSRQEAQPVSGDFQPLLFRPLQERGQVPRVTLVTIVGEQFRAGFLTTGKSWPIFHSAGSYHSYRSAAS